MIRDEQLWRDPVGAAVRVVTETAPDGARRPAVEEPYDDPRELADEIGVLDPSTDSRVLRDALLLTQPDLGVQGLVRAAARLPRYHCLDRAQRVALLQVVASVPDLKVFGVQSDRAAVNGADTGSGRPGLAVGVDFSDGPVTFRDTLLIDRMTGRLLSFQTTILTAPAADGLLLPAEQEYLLYLDADRRDSRP